jgi:phospholipase A1
MSRPSFLSCACALMWLCGTAFAADEPALSDCAGIDDDRRRLACYDALAGRKPPQPAAQAAAADEETGEASAAAVAPDVEAEALSLLSRHWELDRDAKQGTFLLRLHKQNYFLPVRHSSNPNQQPESPSRGTAPDQQLQDIEAKFQLSFKLKAIERMLDGRADLWLAYTQQNQWQVYNDDISRPFRETDYEPEVLLVFPTDYSLLGMRGRFVNLGFVHQSNGRADPLSRSWNRVYAQFGFERSNLALLVRPWYRLREKSGEDDNPDIEDYLGYGDLQGIYRSGGHTVSLLLRGNLSEGQGAAQLDYSFPLYGRLKGYLQVFTGYGESLIDYNHQQTTVGLGVLLSE